LKGVKVEEMGNTHTHTYTGFNTIAHMYKLQREWLNITVTFLPKFPCASLHSPWVFSAVFSVEGIGVPLAKKKGAGCCRPSVDINRTNGSFTAGCK